LARANNFLSGSGILVKTGVSMRTQFLVGTLCSVAIAMHAHAQTIEIPRAKNAPPAQPQAPAPPKQAKAETHVEKHVAAQPVKKKAREKPAVSIHAPKTSVARKEKKESSHSKVTIADMRRAGELARERVDKEKQAEHSKAARAASAKQSRPTVVASREPTRQGHGDWIFSRSHDTPMDTAFIRLADGFDFPVGKPDGQGYYKARGFRSHGHLGEDWDGLGGGDTDLGDPIFCIGDGVVVFARDCHQGWGNVIIVRHVFRDGGSIHSIDSLYAHLQKILVRRGEAVRRGQQIATMGTAHGLYDAHLHFEIRKNIEIGMSRAKFAEDLTNYYVPSRFILSHRHLSTRGGKYRVAMNTFTQDSRIRWDKLRNYSHARTGGGSRQSAYALKRALAAQNDSH
jgi:murein DD-endopeptidase MepM/ murein hydrolase activator NlpD